MLDHEIGPGGRVNLGWPRSDGLRWLRRRAGCRQLKFLRLITWAVDGSIIRVVSEPHRLSYVGDSQIAEAFLEILPRHNLVYFPDPPPPPLIEPGMGYEASDPYSIVASGSYDTAETDIAAAIADFAAQFPGRADITDGGAMPSGGVLTFRGRRQLLDDLYPLLNIEQVEVLYPEEDDDWASVEEQIEADATGDAPVELYVTGWGDLRPRVAVAVAAFSGAASRTGSDRLQ